MRAISRHHIRKPLDRSAANAARKDAGRRASTGANRRATSGKGNRHERTSGVRLCSGHGVEKPHRSAV
jgi:hypothetical protein